MREHIAHERGEALLVEAQLQAFEVVFDRATTDAKDGRNLFECLSVGHELEDLALAGTQMTAIAVS